MNLPMITSVFLRRPLPFSSSTRVVLLKVRHSLSAARRRKSDLAAKEQEQRERAEGGATGKRGAKKTPPGLDLTGPGGLGSDERKRSAAAAIEGKLSAAAAVERTFGQRMRSSGIVVDDDPYNTGHTGAGAAGAAGMGASTPGAPNNAMNHYSASFSGGSNGSGGEGMGHTVDQTGWVHVATKELYAWERQWCELIHFADGTGMLAAYNEPPISDYKRWAVAAGPDGSAWIPPTETQRWMVRLDECGHVEVDDRPLDATRSFQFVVGSGGLGPEKRVSVQTSTVSFGVCGLADWVIGTKEVNAMKVSKGVNARRGRERRGGERC